MDRSKAKRWVWSNSLTLEEAKSLIDNLSDQGMSKVNKYITRKQVIKIFKDGIDELMNEKGSDFDLCDSSLGDELFARNIVRECM